MVNMHKNLYIELFGWYGAVAMLAAYALYSFGYFQPGSIWFQFLNLTGAIGIITVSVYKKAWQPALLNLAWAGVAAYSLYVYLI